MPEVTIYTDGACRGNPGVGGWGALMQYRNKVRECKGIEELTTNNRMELMAVIQSLEKLKTTCSIQLYTDSTYVKNGITLWMARWLRNNWQTSAKKPVKNQDLWSHLHRLSQLHKIQWHWVRGHAGCEGNERADALANMAIDEWLKRTKVQ